MKILFISENYPPYIEGGAEISTSLLARWLVKNGNDVSVACCKFASQSWIDEGVNVYPIIRRPMLVSKDPWSVIKYAFHIIVLPVTSSLRILRLIKKLNPDIVNIVVTVYTFIPIVFFVKFFSNKKMCIDCRDYSLICPAQFKNNEEKDPLNTHHGYKCLVKGFAQIKTSIVFFAKIFAVYESVVFNVYKSILRYFVNHTDRITLVANSDYVRHQLEINGFHKDKIAFIYNISQVSEQSDSFEKLTVPVFTYGGRIEKEKGIWDLVAAAEILHHESKKHFLLNIAGIGSELNALRNYVEENKLEYIKILGLIPSKELLILYKQSLAIMAPSRWPEPFGRYILEAVSVGKPVISTRTGGTPEGITDKVNGLLVDVGSKGQLKDAMLYFINNSEQSNIMGEKMKSIRGSFEADSIGKKRLTLYQRKSITK